MNQAEFQAIYDDTAKTIVGDINWSDDEDHSPSVQFRVELRSESGYSLFAVGTFNGLIDKLSYVIIARSVGCILRLCLGSDHHNTSCQNVGGDRHVHVWNEVTRDHEAEAATWVAANADDPMSVWQEFCEWFNVTHVGRMEHPPLPIGVFP